MSKRRIIRISAILVNLIVMGSMFLPYKLMKTWAFKGNVNALQSDLYEYHSGFDIILPLFSFLFLIPITILFFTSKSKVGRIANLILSILLVIFSGLNFIVMSFAIFSQAKPGIGAYILILCAFILLFLTITHLRMPIAQLKNKELLDDF